ncbi:MAG: methyl-accepting chemotaxis protein [Candidatus Nitrosomirales archaeon]
MRDTAKEIHQTATELKESGVTGEIARSIEESGKAAQDTIQTVRDTADQIGEAAPQTSKVVRGGAESVKQESTRAATKIKQGVESIKQTVKDKAELV